MFLRIRPNQTSNLSVDIHKTHGASDKGTTIDKGFHALAADPMKGQDYGAIRDGYRKYQIGKHVIFFHEIDADLIEIVRILHQRMDIELQLSDAT